MTNAELILHSSLALIERVNAIREACPSIRYEQTAKIAKAWAVFSETQCATWLTVDEQTAAQFYEWLDN